MSKPIAKDEQIMQAMKTRYAAIAGGANYNCIFTGKVFVKAQAPIAEGVNIFKDDEAVDAFESSGSLHDCTISANVDIVGINGSVDNVPLMEADILKSTGTDLTWGGLAYKTKHTGSEDNPQDQTGNAIAHRRIKLEIIYRKNAFSA